MLENGDVVAIFQIGIEWKIDEKRWQFLCPEVTVREVLQDFAGTGRQTGRRVQGGRCSSRRRWSTAGHDGCMAATGYCAKYSTQRADAGIGAGLRKRKEKQARKRKRIIIVGAGIPVEDGGKTRVIIDNVDGTQQKMRQEQQIIVDNVDGAVQKMRQGQAKEHRQSRWESAEGETKAVGRLLDRCS